MPWLKNDSFNQDSPAERNVITVNGKAIWSVPVIRPTGSPTDRFNYAQFYKVSEIAAALGKVDKTFAAFKASRQAIKTRPDVTTTMWDIESQSGYYREADDEMLIQGVFLFLHWADPVAYPKDGSVTADVSGLLSGLKFQMAALTNYRDNETQSLEMSPVKYGYYVYDGTGN